MAGIFDEAACGVGLAVVGPPLSLGGSRACHWQRVRQVRATAFGWRGLLSAARVLFFLYRWIAQGKARPMPQVTGQPGGILGQPPDLWSSLGRHRCYPSTTPTATPVPHTPQPPRPSPSPTGPTPPHPATPSPSPQPCMPQPRRIIRRRARAPYHATTAAAGCPQSPAPCGRWTPCTAGSCPKRGAGR